MNETPQQWKHIRLGTDADIAIATTLDDTLLDLGVVREWGAELHRLVDEFGYSKIVLDCSKVTYISSAALNKLIGLQKKVAAAKGSLVLCGLAPAVRDVFELTRLNQKFTIRKDQRAARDHIWLPSTS